MTRKVQIIAHLPKKKKPLNGNNLIFFYEIKCLFNNSLKPKQGKSSITITSQNSYKFKRMLTIISYNLTFWEDLKAMASHFFH